MAKTIKGTTSTGFAYEISAKRLNNYELVEALGEMEENPLSFPKVMKLLLGDQVADLKNHVRDEEGFVSTELLMAECKDIFSQQQVKK